ncbi:hypothetical protein Tco_1035532 [Tanacetum coccineum]
MRIDELHKFSDGTLNDVQTAPNERLKGIRMEYLPQTIVLRIILVILPEHQSDTQVITMKMEILLESTSNKLMVGDLCDSIRIKLVTTGKKRWCDSIRIKLVPGSDNENMLSLVDPHGFEGYLKMEVKVPDSS